MNCIITLSLKKGAETHTFHSDLELDEFLMRNKDKFSKLYKIKKGQDYDKIFSTQASEETTVENTKNILKDVEKQADIFSKNKSASNVTYDYSLEEDIEKSANKKGLAMTSFVQMCTQKGNIGKPSNPTFDIHQYRMKFIAENQNLTEAERAYLWNERLIRQETNRLIGNDGHLIYEILFKSNLKPKDVENIKSMIKDKSKFETIISTYFSTFKSKEIIKKLGFISTTNSNQPQLKRKYEAFRILFNSCWENYIKILDEFPDATFYPEFAVVSNQIDSTIKHVINHASKDQLKNIERIEGRIDLLIVDKDGVCHIRDWKFSGNEVGNWSEQDNTVIKQNNWWHSIKKNLGFDQIAGYSAILEQKNLSVGTAKLVPTVIKLEIPQTNIQDISNLSIEKLRELAKNHFFHISQIYNDEEAMNNDDVQLALVNSRKKRMENLLSVTKAIKLDSINNVNEVINTMFPELNLTQEQLRHFTADIEFYKNKLGFIQKFDKNSDDYKQGYRYYFFTRDLKENEKIKARSEEELNEKLALYVAKLNQEISQQMQTFADGYINFSNNYDVTGDENDLRGWMSEFSDDKITYIKERFRKYYRNSWKLFRNEALINQGIFLFKKDNVIDIVILSEKNIHYMHKINGQNNLLGFQFKDGEMNTDDYNIMKPQYGNLLIIKALLLLGANPEIMQDNVLNNIKVVQPWHQQEVSTHSNEYLIETMKALYNAYNQHTKNNKDAPRFPVMNWYDKILSTEKHCLHEATSILNSSEVGDSLYYVDFERIVSGCTFAPKEIIKFLYQIRRKNQNTYNNIHTDAGYLYYQLQMLLLTYQGIHPYEHEDIGNISTGGLHFSGLRISNPAQSESTNARALEALFSVYRDSYTEEFTIIAEKFRKLGKEAYEEAGFNFYTDSAENFWRQFFETNPDGTLKSTFSLKRLYDPIYNDKPKAKKLIEWVLETMNHARYPYLEEEDFDKFKSQDKYYEMPLLESGWFDAAKEGIRHNGIKGMMDAMQKKIQNVATRMEGYYAGKKMHYDNYKKNNPNAAYNRFFDMDENLRSELLNDQGRAWDTNIESIFLTSMAAQAVTNASKKYAEYFAAFKAGVEYMSSVGGINYKNTLQYIEDYINNKVFLKQIREESLDGINGILSVLKRMSSTLSLGLFSTRPLGRELLVGLYTVNARAINNLIPGITEENFVDAFKYVITQAPVDCTANGFVAALNRRYAMSSYSRTDMADITRIAHWGGRNLKLGDTFIGTKIADNYFRLSILIAKMKADGCFDAYSLNEEGELEYDEKKDERFKAYLNNDKSDLKKYQEQRLLYLDLMNQYNLVEGEDVLPDAYPPKIKASIRTIANELLGFFDQEDKSLLTASLLGSALMQYKTWFSAKLNQHLKKPGHVNIWERKIVTDEDGVELWEVISNEEEVQNGLPIIRYVRKDEVDPKWIQEGRAVPYIITEGVYQGGSMDSIFSFLTNLRTKNLNEFKENWKKPIFRGQFIMGLLDTFAMYLLIGIIKRMFGFETYSDIRKASWAEQWTYGVLMGFAQDGPINLTIQNVIGDFNPPVYLSLQRWAKTVESVFSGDQSFLGGVAETVGALREFRGSF